MKIKLVSILLLALSSPSLVADEAASKHKLGFKQKLRFFMEVGIQGGGDGTEPLPLYNRADGLYYSGIPYTLVGEWSGLPSDVDSRFEDDVEAGGLYKVAFGADIPLFSDVTLMVSYGYQFDEVYGDLTDGSGGKGSFEYRRQTLELIPFYNMGRHRVGLGAEMHLQPHGIHHEYSSLFDMKTNYRFDDAVGATIRYDYLVNENTSIGIRYTEIAYDFDRLSTRYDVNGVTVDSFSSDCLANCDEVVDADSLGLQLTYRF